MGMYNEVFKKCADCGTVCTVQIGQIELGFGGYDLDDPRSTTHLSRLQKEELVDFVSGEKFLCECGFTFRVKVIIGEPSGNTVYI
jgi:hypothetical protein